MALSVVGISFPTKYRKRERFIAQSGDRMQPVYKMSVDENGVRELKQVSQIDAYAQIQSYKESTDVNVILERFARGDVSALSKIQGVYGDFTNMPKTMAELSQRVLDAENLFNTLPLDVRGQFNFSPSEFFAAIGTDKFNAIFKDDTPVPAPQDPPVVVPSETIPNDKPEVTV